jgi:hypothetical protein
MTTITKDIKSIIKSSVALPVGALSFTATLVADTFKLTTTVIESAPKLLKAVGNSSIEASYGAFNYDMELEELRTHITTQRAQTLDKSLEEMVSKAAPAAAKAMRATLAAFDAE